MTRHTETSTFLPPIYPGTTVSFPPVDVRVRCTVRFVGTAVNVWPADTRPSR